MKQPHSTSFEVTGLSRSSSYVTLAESEIFCFDPSIVPPPISGRRKVP